MAVVCAWELDGRSGWRQSPSHPQLMVPDGERNYLLTIEQSCEVAVSSCCLHNGAGQFQDLLGGGLLGFAGLLDSAQVGLWYFLLL